MPDGTIPPLDIGSKKLTRPIDPRSSTQRIPPPNRHRPNNVPLQRLPLNQVGGVGFPISGTAFPIGGLGLLPLQSGSKIKGQTRNRNTP